MHILIAPDSFKESLSAFEVAKAIQKGFAKAMPEATFDLMPVGDGGEGTLQALQDGLGLQAASHVVTGPFGEKIQAHYAWKDKLAIFEMADICGLEKIPSHQRSPLTLSSKGIGELLIHMAQSGFKEVMIGVGGSATNDGGIGMASGLGYRFFDRDGQELEPVGASLGKVARLQVPKDNPLASLKLTVITDVTNGLCGRTGATYVFAGQKGLSEKDFEAVDQAMRSFYELANPKIFELTAVGAGGGMAAGLLTFAGGDLTSGIDAVLDILEADKRMKKADLLIVGEGRMDQQSLKGKAPVGLAARAPKGLPVIAICGSLKDDLPDFPVAKIQAAFPIIAGVDSLENTLAQASQNLERTAQNVANVIKIGLYMT